MLKGKIRKYPLVSTQYNTMHGLPDMLYPNLILPSSFVLWTSVTTLSLTQL